MSADHKTIVLDRDGVINYDSDEFIKTPEEWQPLPGSLESIARLSAAGYDVAVISNQSGIGRGIFGVAALDRIHARMIASVEAAGGRLAGIYYCPHAPTAACDCRKPKPGLLRALQADLGLPGLTGVPIVGDKRSDLELAAAVGARGILVLTGKGRMTARELPPEAEIEIYRDLAAAVDALLGEPAA